MAAQGTVRKIAVRGFRPSKNGFKFPNRFEGIPLPEALGKVIDTSRSVHGLCGGMCFTVIDHVKAKKPLPEVEKVPDNESSLYKYLAQRQMASWGVLSSQVLRYVQWMTLSDEKAQMESLESWETLRSKLDTGDLTVIGLVYNDFRESLKVWDNHQVLAYGYEIDPTGAIKIMVYDPNYASEDNIFVKAKPVTVRHANGQEAKGLSCSQFRGRTKIHDVHGFLVVPYDYTPPPDRID